MTDRVEPPPTPVSAPAPGSTANQVLAWAGVAAAAVFIVAVVFFSGFFIGRSTDSGGIHGRYHGPTMMGPGQWGPSQPQAPTNQPQPPTTSPRP